MDRRYLQNNIFKMRYNSQKGTQIPQKVKTRSEGY